MRMAISRKKLIVWFFNIILLGVSVFFLWRVWNTSVVDKKWSTEAFFLSVVCIVINLITIKVYRIKLHEFIFAFMVLAYLFMYGRIWLNYLQLDADIHWMLHRLFDVEQMRRASVYCVCCTQAVFMGLLLNYKPNDTKRLLEKRDLEQIDSNGTLFLVGIILLLFGGPCRIITDIRSVISTAATGSFVSISAQTGLIDDLAYLVVPGIICVMESRPKYRTVLFSIVAFYFVVIMAVTGDRRFYVAALLALGSYILYRKEYSSKRLKWWHWLILILGACLFLNFLEVVRKMRAGGLGSFYNFISNYGGDVFVLDDLLYDILVEFGISFYSVVAIVTHTPSVVPYQYGMSIVRSIPSILPIGSIFGDFFSKASPSDIINKYTGLPVGATLFGDLYANYAIMGVLATFVIGILLGKLFDKSKCTRSKKSVVLYYTKYFVLINLVRCCIFEIVRPLVWCVMIPLILFAVINQRNRRIG